MSSNDLEDARLALIELVADFLCYMGINGGAVNEKHFEANLLVAEMLMQSVSLAITDADNNGVIKATMNIGFEGADVIN